MIYCFPSHHKTKAIGLFIFIRAAARESEERNMNTMLMILDGFGISPRVEGNAIAQAKKPALDALFSSCPHTSVGASGLSVGLPEGQMGNSEVGHLNIGAGRIVYQELTRISKAIEDGSFFHNPALNRAADHVLQHRSALHLFGLLSDGGVHSHISHLFALIDFAKMRGVEKLYVHVFLDGRDVPPRCAKIYLAQLDTYMKEKGLGEILVVSGRYYAMDRDNRWERVIKAYDAMTLGEGEHASSWEEAVDAAYHRGENDEFVLPTVITTPGKTPAVIEDNDSILMFNFRPDRAREITRCFADDNFNGFQRKARPSNLCYVCMTQYDAEMPNVTVAFPPQSLKNTLGEYLGEKGIRQLRIAETEKYAHVTFFFNGGVEAPNRGEDRILIPSPKVATYDLQPEMSAPEVTRQVIDKISEEIYDIIILNFANPDMVGHTGVMEAAVKAIETLDSCIEQIVKALDAHGGRLLLTADHGNADRMMDEQGNVVTAHSLNPVPLLIRPGKEDTLHAFELEEGGILADVVPTLLELAGIGKPSEMTGHSLIRRSK